MSTNNLDELEAVILRKRLAFLREQGVDGYLLSQLGPDFFEKLEDHWTFNAILSNLYAVKEMKNEDREQAVDETIPDWETEDV